MEDQESRYSQENRSNRNLIAGKDYYPFSCEKKRWSVHKTDFIIRSLLPRYQSSRGDTKSTNQQSHLEEPTTSNCNRSVSIAKQSTNTTISINPTALPLRSIMKTGTHVKQTSTVKFALPEKSEEFDRRHKKLSYGDRCLRFWNKPMCKIIAAIIFCVVLPCSLIYLAIYYASKLRGKKKPMYRGKPFT